MHQTFTRNSVRLFCIHEQMTVGIEVNIFFFWLSKNAGSNPSNNKRCGEFFCKWRFFQVI